MSQDHPHRLPLKPFLHMVRSTRPSPVRLAVALLLGLVTTAAGLAIPWFTGDLIDSYTRTSITMPQIIGLSVAFVAQAVAGGLSVYLLTHVGQNVVAALRERLWQKMLDLPVNYYDRHQTGETVSRVISDTAVIKELISEHMTGLFTSIVSILGTVAILLYLDWRMTLLMLLIIPLTLAVLIPVGTAMYNVSKGLQNETAGFSATLTRVLSEIRLVKASNAEPKEYKDGHLKIRSLFAYGLKEGLMQALVSPLISLCMLLMLVVIIGYGGMRVASGDMTAGDWVAIMIYLFQLVMPIAQMGSFFTQFQKAMGATERIQTLLDMEEEDRFSGEKVKNARLPITLEQVTFAYETGKAVLNDVSFTVPAGKVTAIVGPSGSGKTTLFSLLERFYRPVHGSIRLGPDSIDRFALDSWRSRLGYVSQESPLQSGTIRDNLVYGLDRKISETELREAARMAYADRFIEEVELGYDTEVGERGIKLSGGQRQRIAIARALLRNPDILMLDEATSSLDSQSEMMVQQALKNLMHGRTTLVIAHRLATVMDADQIIFLDRGVVTGIGTHSQLVETHPLYRQFAQQQLRLEAAERPTQGETQPRETPIDWSEAK